MDNGTCAPLAGSLVISELATGGPASGTDEFVELYNRTAVPLEVGGVTLAYRSASGATYTVRATLGATVVIPAYSYFLLGSGGYVGSVTPDMPSAWGSGFSVIGGHVQIARATEIIDTIGWHTAIAPEGTSVTAPSIDGTWSCERRAYATSNVGSMTSGADALHGNGSDSNDNGVDFIIRPTRDPQNLASAAEMP